MANERRRVCNWNEDPQAMHLGWPVHWEAETMSSQENSIVEGNNGWGQGDGFGSYTWHCRDDKHGNWRQHRRTRLWNAEAPLVRGARTKRRGRGRGDLIRNSTWADHDGSGPSELAYRASHDGAASGDEVKQENEEPSVVVLDDEPQSRGEESNIEVLAASGGHVELESHARHFLRLIEQARHTFECKEQEHRNLYKKTRLEADSEHQQRRDLQQQLFNECRENEKLLAEVESLRTEVASKQAEVDREKKSCLKWRERFMKDEGKVDKLRGEIEQLNEVRSDNVKLTNELQGLRAQHLSEQSKSAKLQEQLTELESSRKLLQEAHDRATHDLQEEKEKALCQICMDRPRDTCSLPCVHLNYCSQCLHKHLETNKTCPACRTPTSGTLQTSLYTIM